MGIKLFLNDYYVLLKFMHDNEVVILDEKVIPLTQQEIATTLKCSKMKIDSMFSILQKQDYIEQKTRGNADETAIIHKLYLNDIDGKVPENIWTKGDAGTTRQATTELKILFGGKAPFDTPKPTQLLERIIQIASDDKSIILDSFAGSGTTAHAVLNMNKSDGGNRKFILVEMGDYADTITAERVKRVINGYGEEKNAVEGTGGNFSYYELGNPLFMQDGTINNEVDITEVRKYVWYTETNGIEYKEDTQEKYFLGSYNETAYYFYYEKDRVTILDYEFLTSVHKKEQAYVMYADSCALSDSDLQKWNITFKKIPRDIEHI